LVTCYEDVARVLKDNNFAKDPLNAQDPERLPIVLGRTSYALRRGTAHYL
jgi:hypothetical protein